MSASAPLVSGIRRLKDAALLLIIANILVGIGAIAAYAAIIPATFMGFMHRWGPAGIVVSIGAGAIAMIGIMVAGLILALIAVYTKLVPGSRDLAQHDPSNFETPHKLIKVGYIAGLILTIVGIATLIVLVGIPLVIVGIILLIIGVIGAAILLIRLHDVFDKTLLLVAGILLIIGIFIPLAGFVGWILAYIDLSSLARKLETESGQQSALGVGGG